MVFPNPEQGSGDAFSMVWIILDCGLRGYSKMLWPGGIRSCHVLYIGGTAARR